MQQEVATLEQECVLFDIKFSKYQEPFLTSMVTAEKLEKMHSFVYTMTDHQCYPPAVAGSVQAGEWSSEAVVGLCPPGPVLHRGVEENNLEPAGCREHGR